MFIPKRSLVYAILLAVLLEPIAGRKGLSGGHSYPKSGGLSGGGHRSGGLSGGGHGYPSGGSHSYPSHQSSGSHGYPSSGGLSGNSGSSGSHGYPSSGGSHTYPSSGGNHGYPSSGGSNKYPSSGGSHGYPSSGGLSGNNNGYNKPGGAVRHTTHTTNVYNYHYSPPQQITYRPAYGGAPINYPVFRGTPPTYVYQYKNSNSKYGTLLAGLALLNLGTLGALAYTSTHGKSTHYTPQPGEVCKFAVQRDNGDYEETKIDCQIISSFIYQYQDEQRNSGTNSTVSITVTNTTITNMTNNLPEQATTAAPVVPALGNVLYTMLPNGTLVPVNATAFGIPGLPGSPLNVTQNVSGALAPNGSVVTSSVVTTTTTNTTVVNALDVKGPAVQVTPGMKCFVIRNSPTSTMKKHVPCGLLQTYADKSIRRNSAVRNVPMFTLVAAIIAFCVAY